MDKELAEKLSKVQALMDRAGNAAEAEAAAAAMQRLILKHNLDEADLQNLGQKERAEYISKYVRLGTKNSQGLQWRINLAYAMAQMNFCAFIREGVHGGTGWVIGQAANVEAVEIMFKATAETNDRIVDPEWFTFKNSHEYYRYGQPNARAWKNSFQIGFVAGIRMKMQNERQAMAGELEAGVVSALVVVNEAELKEAVTEKLGRTTTHKGSAPTSKSGFQRGVARGLEHSFAEAIER